MRLILPFLFLTIVLSAQESIDIGTQPNNLNFEKAMAVENPTSAQLDSMTRLCMYYSQVNLDTSQVLGKRAVYFGENHENQDLHAQALLQLGYATGRAGDLNEAEKLLLKGRSIYESLNKESQTANANNKLGHIYSQKGNYDAAVVCFLSAVKLWETVKDSQNIAKPYLNIAQVFYRLGQDEKAKTYNAKAIEWAEMVNDDLVKMLAFSNQGIHSHDQGDTYNHIADTISSNSQIYKDSAFLFYNQAFNDYTQSLAMAKQMNHKPAIVEFLSNMMVIKTSLEEMDEVLRLGKEAELVAKELGGISPILRIKLPMTRAFRLMGQLQKSVEYGEESLKLAQENGMDKQERMAYSYLHDAYKDLGKFDKALFNYEKYIASVKERDKLERIEAIAEVESKFQTVKKEKQILELETANANIEKQRNYLFGGVLFLGILVFFGYRFNKVRKDRNDKKAFAEALIYAQEEERKRIARDLHDGIGQSLLLMKKQLVSNHTVTLENQHLITNTLEEVRSISRDLHPFQLEKFGLTATIDEAIRKIEHSTDLFISKEMDNIDKVFSDKSEINIYRTIQEAFNNIVKHSDATAAKIVIQSSDNEIFMKIQDNGKGFDHELAIVRSKSLGLRTMYERIAGIGGKLKIGKGETNGTIIEIHIPKK